MEIESVTYQILYIMPGDRGGLSFFLFDLFNSDQLWDTFLLHNNKDKLCECTETSAARNLKTRNKKKKKKRERDREKTVGVTCESGIKWIYTLFRVSPLITLRKYKIYLIVFSVGNLNLIHNTIILNWRRSSGVVLDTLLYWSWLDFFLLFEQVGSTRAELCFMDGQDAGRQQPVRPSVCYFKTPAATQ